ncbi:hypothetical protein E2C01_040948 [Portunus trituberculatus]|uniref:Uncharacterized protein n=1 Tax=Portunus trituberculatus TaxID=210409 RepID=A0A5B7FPL9_PORTR|nr:hypothetical protein [Portunus trituberculatus]
MDRQISRWEGTRISLAGRGSCGARLRGGTSLCHVTLRRPEYSMTRMVCVMLVSAWCTGATGLRELFALPPPERKPVVRRVTGEEGSHG